LSAVTDALQAYADRGVFRGFRATPGARGRIAYEFMWLTRKALHADYDSRSRTIRFAELLPAIDRAIAAEVTAILDARRNRNAPNHKRIDGRRVRVAGTVRRGAYSLQMLVRGDNHEYAVSTALNVINEIVVALREHHHEYLIEHFGLSAE
jgi:hypothetical protein